MKLAYAKARSLQSAKAVVFGANTNGAGLSATLDKIVPHAKDVVFSADAIRQADNDSPALPENLRLGDALFDDGNIDLVGRSQTQQLEILKNYFVKLFKNKQFPIGLGGDHLLKFASFAALSEVHPGCGIVYVDAHPDCFLDPQITYLSILNHTFQLKGLSPKKTSIIGLRQITEPEVPGFKKWKPHTIPSSDFTHLGMKGVIAKLKKQLKGCKKVFISVDLDGLDPVSAPAVEALYPGGPTLDHMVGMIHGLAKSFKIVGMDITEHVPRLDTQKLTALTASRILKEAYSVGVSTSGAPKS